MHLFLLIFIIDFGLQVVFGLLSIILQTEKFYDFVGSATFITCALTGALYSKGSQLDLGIKLIQALCICFWAGKLGSFLLYRVIKSGKDSRFDDAKKKPLKLFIFWMLQGCWVFLNMAPTICLFISDKKDDIKDVNFVCIIGWVIFAFGLIFETVSDYQKTVFRNNPANKGRFITSGLWSISRHPNYFGEIVLWYGLFISAAPYFSSNWAYFTILCPTATAAQICFLSGIPLLEKSGMERWGNDPDYAAYVHSTGVLIPWLVCCECTPLPSKDLLVKPGETPSSSKQEEEEQEGPDGQMVNVDLNAVDSGAV